MMGPTCRMLFVLILLAVAVSNVRARCPPPNQVRGPTCRENYDCRKGPCCPNSFGTKNCVDSVPINKYQQHSDARTNQYKLGGPGVYCDGVKCLPHQVCKPDRFTKKLRCQ